MARPEQESGFLSRWSRLKAQARSETAPQEAPAPAETVPETAVPLDAQPIRSVDVMPVAEPGELVAPPAEPADAASEKPPLTLADVVQLTRDSDFSPFVAADVKIEVKNAALKKLFSDPHFNVMDGLDVYIDDYNTPNPLPSNLILQMAQAKFLGLVKDAAQELIADRPPPVNRGTIGAEPDCATAEQPPAAPPAENNASNEDAHLQLQPHDAAGRVHADPGTGENGGREH
jgi:hypothetical protein